jgi:hypothetical protein
MVNAVAGQIGKCSNTSKGFTYNSIDKGLGCKWASFTEMKAGLGYRIDTPNTLTLLQEIRLLN